MPISKEQVEHIAELSHLQLSPRSLEKFQKELSSILGYIEKLEKLDTDNVEPLTHAAGKASEGREDKVDKDREFSQKAALQNAPEKEDGYIQVKSVFQ